MLRKSALLDYENIELYEVKLLLAFCPFTQAQVQIKLLILFGEYLFQQVCCPNSGIGANFQFLFGNHAK